MALRKVRTLLEAEALVRVISPELDPELMILAENGKVEWLKRGYITGDLKGAFLAFAMTNDRTVQDKVAKEAERFAVLLNSADDPQGSDFHVPANFRRGKMLVTVSTEGGSPALAKRVRELLEKVITPEYEAVVDLLAMIRERSVGRYDDAEAHGELFNRLLDFGLVDLLLDANWFDLQMLLLQELPKDIDAVALIRQFLSKHDKSIG